MQALKRRAVALREDLRWAENTACGRRVLRRLRRRIGIAVGLLQRAKGRRTRILCAGTAGSDPRSEDDAKIRDLEQPRAQPLGRPKWGGAEDQMFPDPREAPTLGLPSSHGRPWPRWLRGVQPLRTAPDSRGAGPDCLSNERCLDPMVARWWSQDIRLLFSGGRHSVPPDGLATRDLSSRGVRSNLG